MYNVQCSVFNSCLTEFFPKLSIFEGNFGIKCKKLPIFKRKKNNLGLLYIRRWAESQILNLLIKPPGCKMLFCWILQKSIKPLICSALLVSLNSILSFYNQGVSFYINVRGLYFSLKFYWVTVEKSFIYLFWHKNQKDGKNKDNLNISHHKY